MISGFVQWVHKAVIYLIRSKKSIPKSESSRTDLPIISTFPTRQCSIKLEVQLNDHVLEGRMKKVIARLTMLEEERVNRIIVNRGHYVNNELFLHAVYKAGKFKNELTGGVNEMIETIISQTEPKVKSHLKFWIGND